MPALAAGRDSRHAPAHPSLSDPLTGVLKVSLVKRILSPSLNPTGIGAAIAAVYAAVVMIWNASHHHGVIDPQVIVAALGAAAFLYSRMKVTPVADPKDGDGHPLVHAWGSSRAPSNVTAVPASDVTIVPPVPGLPEAKL